MAEQPPPRGATVLVGLGLVTVSIVIPGLVAAFGLPLDGVGYVEIGVPDAALAWMLFWLATLGLLLGVGAVLYGGVWRSSR